MRPDARRIPRGSVHAFPTATKRHRRLVTRTPLALVLGLLAGVPVVRADLVTDWNEVFLHAVRNETTPPPLAARNAAMLHIAVFDAVNAITRTHRPYLFKGSTSSEASIEAAASAAAHRVAAALYPSRKAGFDSLLERTLAALPENAARTNGVILGRQAAGIILDARINDGSNTTVPYIPSDAPGRWRRTPPYHRPPELPHWRLVTPFVLTNPAQFRLPGPPALNSRRYAEDFHQVRMLGARKSATRTPEQTQIALFWSDFSYTVTPPGHWNEIARNVALARGTSVEENARLFALLNLAMADAAIVVWDVKYAYDSWRPVTAVRQAERDGNDETAAELQWEPLLPTPAFPEYVSGHSAFSSAAAAVLARFFGTDKVAFTVGCDALPGVTRSYNSFRAAAEEIGMSRIFGGIHFMSANRDGLAAGEAVAEFILQSALLPARPIPASGG